MNRKQQAILESTYGPIVKMSARHGKPVCPLCGKVGNFYGVGGQADDDTHEWFWDTTQAGHVLVAFMKR